MTNKLKNTAGAAPPISGYSAPGYEGVKEAFARNFIEEQEIGAAICLYVNGEKVVDLWAGYKDAEQREPWLEDTVVNVWSTTKGAAAACVAHLAQSGKLDIHAPVAKYWPEFGTAGKEDVTVAQLFSHQAGLCGLGSAISVEQMFEVDTVAELLAAETPHWAPGSQSGYHALSIGYMADALFKRIVGVTVGEYFRRYIAEPLGLEFYMGMTDEETTRAAHIMHDGEPISGGPERYSPYEVLALGNFPVDHRLANMKKWQVMGLPSAGAAASARGVASLYRTLISDLSGNTSHIAGTEVLRDMLACQIEGEDLVLRVPMKWGVGFALNGVSGLYGPNESTFGHNGWGGSFGFGDPESDIAVGYSMNYMREPLAGDMRAIKLIRAIYEAAGD